MSLQWLRSLRGQGFQLRLQLTNGKFCVFEGFSGDSCAGLADFLRSNYNLPLQLAESSGKGWNWGKIEVEAEENSKNRSGDTLKGVLKYSIAGRLAMQVPLTHVSNALVASKNELALEFANGIDGNPSGVEDKSVDQITELRFYLPDEKDGNETGEEDTEAENEEAPMTDAAPSSLKNEDLMDYEELDISSARTDSTSNATSINLASKFLEDIKALSDFSKVSGEVLAALPEIAFAVPRGRYRIDMFDSFMRMHGKSYDFKIEYTSLQRLFLLPKTDDAHILLVLALDPPIKQGLTRYPHLIMQFPKEEMVSEFELKSVSATDLAGKYGGKLQMRYTDVSAFELVSVLMRGLAGQKIVVPGGFKSVISGHPALKCTIKASEGALYMLEKNILFVPKPTLLIAHADVAQCVFSRVGGPTSSFGGNPRSFDLKISVRGSGAEHVFSNIAKEELENLIEFLQNKQLPFTMEEEGRVRGKASATADDILGIDEDEDESEDEDYESGEEGSEGSEGSDGSEGSEDDDSYDEDEEDEDAMEE